MKIHIEDIVHDIEEEMVSMWSLDEATSVMERDPEYIKIVLTAVFYERKHFEALGMVIGEA